MPVRSVVSAVALAFASLTTASGCVAAATDQEGLDGTEAPSTVTAGVSADSDDTPGPLDHPQQFEAPIMVKTGLRPPPVYDDSDRMEPRARSYGGCLINVYEIWDPARGKTLRYVVCN